MGLGKSGELKRLQSQMDSAENYGEWRVAALLHDEATRMDKWRETEQTRFYDHASIRHRLDKLIRLRRSGDDHGLLFALNEGIHGNMGGMGKPALYSRAIYSTKHLVVDYIDEIVDALEYLAGVENEEVDFEERLEFFRRASHCYGRSALMLSGGAMLGFFHLGVVKSLVEQDLLPNVISGASAGSMVAGVLGTHTNEELLQFFDPQHLVVEARSDASWINRLLGSKNIDVHDLRETVARLIPDLTFQEAYELTGRHINISISAAEVHQTSRLLNATTSPNVLIRSAVMASSAVPGVFPPVTLEARNVHGEKQDYLPRRKWVDGSLDGDMPAKRLARLYGVNHYIASQTNPLALLTLRDPHQDKGLSGLAWQIGERTLKEWLRMSHNVSQRYTKKYPRYNLFANAIVSVATQEYTADINIIPNYRFFDPRKLLSQLTPEELLKLIRAGERATWPRMEMIRNCSKIGNKLDQIVMDYEAEALRRLHIAIGGQDGSEQDAA